MKNIEIQKRAFIENEILGLVVQGAFRRVRIYEDDFDEKQKEQFRLDVKNLLKKSSEPYRASEVSSDEHIENIEHLRTAISGVSHGSFSFGVAQKLLNLYLKYLWCLGDLKFSPPHCPVDSIVLKEIKQPEPRWPILDQSIYKTRIEEIRSIAPTQHIAEWELSFFNRKNPVYGNYPLHS